MTDPYQSGALTRQPFSRNNSSVTTPLFCACTRNPLGAYAAQPFCHGHTEAALVESYEGGVATLRSPQQTLAFGPEIYQGHYGMAYKLRFPDQGGPLYQYEQCRAADGTFAPCNASNACSACAAASQMNRSECVYQPTMPEFNTGAGYLNPSGRYVIVGSRTSPYFRVFNAPPNNAAPNM